jgi:hypothetical protein
MLRPYPFNEMWEFQTNTNMSFITATFQCEDPDFLVRSIPDDISFPVRRDALNASQVFRMLTPYRLQCD